MVQTGLLLSATALAFACSDEEDDDAGGGTAANGAGARAGATGLGGSAGTTGSGGSGNTSSGISGSGSVPADACHGLPYTPPAGEAGAGGEGGEASGPDDSSCVGVSLEAERIPVDMYIMMDRSVSMAEEVPNTGGRYRWQLLTDAVREFVQKPEAAEIGMGIQFFGQSGIKDDALDCNVANYSTPKVEIGPAATTGPTIVAEMEELIPGGLTPTMPALQGAVDHAKAWATAHPGRATVVVLVTDGYPTQCQNPVSVSAIADVAEQAATSNPRVLTYVVGLAAGFNLDTIARSGGTRQALIVTEGNITESFVNTLLNISANPLACEYEIPQPPTGSGQLDPEKVSVIHRPAVGQAEEIPKASSRAECATSKAGGWYYDNPANPTKIIACPCTCASLAAGSIDIRLGCKPRPVPIE